MGSASACANADIYRHPDDLSMSGHNASAALSQLTLAKAQRRDARSPAKSVGKA
jgi:hypothetical protein